MKIETKKVSKTSLLTRKRLLEVLHYAPDTGVWMWKVNRRGTAKVGSRAGCINKDGYRQIKIEGVLHGSARLAFLYMLGAYPIEVDHKNRIRHDDRWENIRDFDHRGNSRNRGIQSNNKSGITGVSFHEQTGKWQTYIKPRDKEIYLGRYEDLHTAVFIRYCAELEHNWSASNPNSSAKQYVDKYFNRNTTTKTGVIE